jgi:hypothetical protein
VERLGDRMFRDDPFFAAIRATEPSIYWASIRRIAQAKDEEERQQAVLQSVVENVELTNRRMASADDDVVVDHARAVLAIRERYLASLTDPSSGVVAAEDRETHERRSAEEAIGPGAALLYATQKGSARPPDDLRPAIVLLKDVLRQFNDDDLLAVAMSVIPVLGEDQRSPPASLEILVLMNRAILALSKESAAEILRATGRNPNIVSNAVADVVCERKLKFW